MAEQKPIVYDQDKKLFLDFFQFHNEKLFRANQLWQGLYRNFWLSADEFTNYPLSTRELLKSEFRFDIIKQITEIISSDRLTRKILFSLYDGNTIETVLMHYRNRNTLCISTQSGCAMDCIFCATGQMGFRRNLSSGEIISQVMFFAAQLLKVGHQLTNIVIMGMGEPFHNYENTLQAIDRLNDPTGFNMGERRFTISTAGLVPMIKKFSAEKRQVNLAISLHAADDDLRSRLMPINKKYPLALLMDACNDYIANTNRRITFEWILIKGINDNEEQAKLLSSLIRNMLCHVNLIPLNQTNDFPQQPSSSEQVKSFQNILLRNGINCSVRLRRGIDISAGCGQLSSGLVL